MSVRLADLLVLADLVCKLCRGFMEKRDILDYQGNKIGELELPAGTSEEVWQDKLDKYKVPPEQVE